jgi:Tol biopolymer transport system component
VTPGNVYHYKLSGDGKTAVYYSTQPSTGVYIVDLEQFPFISTPILIAGGFSDGGVSISSDGELIAFSTSSALVADDINGHYDVYTWTRSTGIFERVTAFEFDPAPSQMGNYSSHFVTENNGSTFSPQLSRNGRFLALQSVSDHFTPFDFPLDTGDYRDVFVIDLHSKLVHRSTRSETWQNYFSGIDDDGDKYSKTELTIGPIVSDDGSRVVFYSDLNQPFAGLSGNGKNQIYVDQCPTFSASSYPIRCAGDGLLGACPMGNNGAKNRGCAHSVNAKGAKLEAWGMASVSNPAVFKLVVSGLPDSSTVALFEMNGSVNQNGISWGGGDGLRCVGFQAQTKIVVPGVTNQTLHFGYGQTFNPHLNLSALPFSTKTYQVKYRDKAANFGTTSTFNWTNAIEVLWLP